jgi:AcrR family transcriptional regulator
LSVSSLPAPRKAGRPGRPARQHGHPDRRDQILDAAEKLYGERGFHGVTVREVTSAAQVDVALVYYYFTNKRDLFDAVLMRRATIVNRDRIERLQRIELDPQDDRIEQLVSAFIDPLFEHLASGEPGWRSYFALIAQVNNTSDWGGEVMAHFFDPVVKQLISGMRRVLPDMQDDDLYWAYQFLSGALTLTLAATGRVERLSGGLCRSDDYQAVQGRLPRFIAAGFRQLYADRQRGALPTHPSTTERPS